MDYAEFFARFGGSARTKNLRPPSGVRDPAEADRPVMALPATSGLPREFIRLDPWEMEFLYVLARRARVGIVEIGRFDGGSTFLLGCANRRVAIHSIDNAPRDDDRLKGLFSEHGIGGNVLLLVGDSRERRPEIGPVDLLFIDGDHGYDGCAADIAAWEPAVASRGLIVFHDCYPAPGYGVQEAVLELLDRKGADMEVVVSPLIGAAHWRHPHGSMSCLRKLR